MTPPGSLRRWCSRAGYCRGSYSHLLLSFAVDCQHCHQPITDDQSLCVTCELAFCRLLIQLANDLTPLRDSLDATLHSGGHAPTRIQTATPPTPIRLDVIDLFDLLDANARELLRVAAGLEA